MKNKLNIKKKTFQEKNKYYKARMESTTTAMLLANSYE